MRTALGEIARSRAGKARVRPDDFANVHYLLEPTQIVGDLFARILTEELRDQHAELATWRVVVDLDVHFRASVARRAAELHGPPVWDVRVRERPPRDPLARAVLDDLGVPFDRRPHGGLRSPV